jgi:DNA-binding transcriptional ArsR family regulator
LAIPYSPTEHHRADTSRQRRPRRKIAPNTDFAPVDLSADSARYATTHTLWGVLPYLTEEMTPREEVTPRELAKLTGKSERQVRRITSQLLDLGLIADRRRIQLVDNWLEICESLADKKGTAGKKQAVIEKLAQDRLARHQSKLVRSGAAFVTEYGTVVVTDTGETV